MIEALKADCDVTLLTRDLPDFDAANRAFGTTLNDRDVRVLQADVRGGWVARRLSPVARLGLLSDHRLLQYARRLVPDFDVVVTANNESDLGRRGVQYVHFPKFVVNRPDPGLRWYQTPWAVSVYQRVCGVATGFQLTRARANVTLANSAWTAALVRERHGLTAEEQHAHHAERLAEVLDACATPQTAASIVPLLSKRALDLHQATFALGEALAHLHALWHEGKVERRLVEAGIYRFTTA